MWINCVQTRYIAVITALCLWTHQLSSDDDLASGGSVLGFGTSGVTNGYRHLGQDFFFLFLFTVQLATLDAGMELRDDAYNW